MKKNMGTLDKVIRIVLALVGGYLLISGLIQGALGIVVGILAAIFLITSIIGFCPLYTIFGISTAKKQ